MLVGVDGSEQSARALDWAVSHARSQGAAVEAVMTVPKTDDSAETHAMMREADSILTTMIETATSGPEHPVPVSAEVVAGDPAVVLVNASRGADLLVLGSHGMSSISNPALGSVSTACIRMGSCPVLVIPAGKPEPPDDGAALAPR